METFAFRKVWGDRVMGVGRLHFRTQNTTLDVALAWRCAFQTELHDVRPRRAAPRGRSPRTSVTPFPGKGARGMVVVPSPS